MHRISFFLLIVYVLCNLSQASSQIPYKFPERQPLAMGETISFEPYGTTAENAVTLDVSEITEFHEGFAIVRKADQYAIINRNGQTIVPYGKYRFNVNGGYRIDNRVFGFHYGCCVAKDVYSGLYGFIDTAGNAITPFSAIEVTPFLGDGYAWGREKDENGREQYYYYNKAGKKFLSKIQDRIRLRDYEYMYPVEENGFTDFYAKNGRLIFKTKRRISGMYADGLIAVDTNFTNEGRKTGFIDTANRLVIPYQFSGLQSPQFRNRRLYIGGFANDYKFRYINTKGENVIAYSYTDANILEPDFHKQFSYDYAYGSCKEGLMILDTSGAMFPLEFYINMHSDWFNIEFKDYKIECNTGDYNNGYETKLIRFKADITYDSAYNGQNTGFLGNMPKTSLVYAHVRISRQGLAYKRSGGLYLPPVFDEIHYPDNESKLAKAVFVDNKTETVRRGFVDRSGRFVILTPNVSLND